MKKFTFKYTPTVWVLLSVVLGLTLAGIGFNVFNLVNYIPSGTTNTVIYSVIIALVSVLMIIDISFMVGGRYLVKDKVLFVCFGFFKSKISLDDVRAVVLFKKSNKLVLYYGQDKYTVIMIADTLYDDFVSAVRKENKKILFSTEIDGEDTPE